MDSQDAKSAGVVGARTPRVEAEMAAARRALQDKRSEADIALDTAVVRMLADLESIPDRLSEREHARAGAAEETAPALHAGARTGMHAGPCEQR